MHKRWGWFKTLLERKHFKVKLLYFEKGKSCSMQRHKFRNEIWLWIFGKGEFYRRTGIVKACWDAKKGDAYIVPNHSWHQYKAKAASLILEIQYGDKCSERDIERV